MPSRPVRWILVATVVLALVAVLALRSAPKPPPVEPHPDPPVAAGPHVVVVMGCTFRADQVAGFGGRADVTPFLAELARQGTRVTDLIAAGPWTRIASAALVTGRHPATLGMADLAAGRNDRALPPSAETLAERFRAAGYATFGATANPNLRPEFGFDQGFDTYLAPTPFWREDTVKVPGVELVDRLLAEVDAADTARPLYLQWMLVDAHQPFAVEPEEAGRFDDGVPATVAEYRVTLARLDAALAHLDAGLATRGLTPENTVFVVVGDHGEGLHHPRHHGPGHGLFLYPSVLHVPWVVRGPGVPAGRTVDGVASGVDVAPTVLGLAGVDGYDGPGLDLSAALRGERQTTGREVAHAATWFRMVQRSAAYTDTVYCLREHDPAAARELKGEKPGFPERCFARADREGVSPVEAPDVVGAQDAWYAAQLEALAEADSVGASLRTGLESWLEALGYTE